MTKETFNIHRGSSLSTDGQTKQFMFKVRPFTAQELYSKGNNVWVEYKDSLYQINKPSFILDNKQETFWVDLKTHMLQNNKR